MSYSNGQQGGIEHVAPRLPAPSRVGQATAIEQSRAAAEVQASVVLAHQKPRNILQARKDIADSCKQPYFAEAAFFRYPRGGSTVTGPSIHMARELARCWGNIQYGIAELSRDDGHGQSEMLAFAWDVQTNARSSTTFIVPHGRDAGGTVKALTDLRDIYENNANMGARRVREMIFAVLPPWLIEEAKELCNQTNAGGGDKPLAARIDEAIVGFARLGVNAERLEQKLGQRKEDWTGYDVAQLRVIFRSIQRREVSVEDEFPPSQVTAADILGQAPAAANAAPAPPPPADAPPASTPADTPDPARSADTNPAILRELSTLMVDCGITPHTGKGSTALNDAARFAWLSDFLGVKVEGSTKNLDPDQATRARDHLRQMKVERSAKRSETERGIAALFDGLDAKLSADDRLRDVSIILRRPIAAPADITDAELADLHDILTSCAGQTHVWDTAVQAARTEQSQASTS